MAESKPYTMQVDKTLQFGIMVENATKMTAGAKKQQVLASLAALKELIEAAEAKATVNAVFLRLNGSAAALTEKDVSAALLANDGHVGNTITALKGRGAPSHRQAAPLSSCVRKSNVSEA